MIKRVIAAAVAGLMMSGSAFAQTAAPSAAPASPEDCLKSAFELAQKAEEMKLSNEQLDKVEDLLAKMEGHCDNKQMTEAAAVADDLKAEIGTSKE